MSPQHRRKPFSGKAKKQQLQEKKARKAAEAQREEEEDRKQMEDLQSSFRKFVPATETHEPLQPGVKYFSGASGAHGRLFSNFEKLSPGAIEKARLQSMKPFKRLPQEIGLEIGENAVSAYINFPKRPQWGYDMTREELDEQETKYFQEWMLSVEDKYGSEDGESQLSLYERNLEVWRQLWRVLEISDIVIVVMDIRHPLLHFPKPLYDYVTRDLKRKIVGVFNKVDLVSEFTVFAWRNYFEEKFPELQVVCFSCFPRDERFIDDTKTYALKARAKRPKKRYYTAQGVKDLLRTCSEIKLDKAGLQVDWEELIKRYDQDEVDIEEEYKKLPLEEDSEDDSDTGSMVGLDDEFSRILDITSRNVAPHRDYITLGLVGHPNVGKSSLINSIMKRTVVSASRTPGHTKHFQTIHLSDTIRLCDSPGLVFPTLLPRALQILSGMYPIAQVQEPYSVVQYLAERVPLEDILSLTPPDLEEAASYLWSAWSICEAFAVQRGFFTAQAARPDVYRAANTILRLVNDGRILMSFKPPGFFKTSKYEKLRVQEAMKNEREEASRNKEQEQSDEEEGEEEEELDPGNIQSKNAFALLADED